MVKPMTELVKNEVKGLKDQALDQLPKVPEIPILDDAVKKKRGTFFNKFTKKANKMKAKEIVPDVKEVVQSVQAAISD